MNVCIDLPAGRVHVHVPVRRNRLDHSIILTPLIVRAVEAPAFTKSLLFSLVDLMTYVVASTL